MHGHGAWVVAIGLAAASPAWGAPAGDRPLAGGGPPVAIRVLDGGVRHATTLCLEPFAGPLWLGGAGAADPAWSLQGGLGACAALAHDTWWPGDAWFLGARLAYGTVDVDAESVARHELVIVAGNEPYLLSGVDRSPVTERLAMLTLTGEWGYAWPAMAGLAPWVTVGGGLVELFGDRGRTSAALRLAAGVEWRVGPSVGATLEVSDLVFRAPVLARHPVHGLGLAAAIRWRF